MSQTPRESRDMMMLANAAYESRADIENSMKDADPSNNLLPKGWKVDLEYNSDGNNGFRATRFINDQTKQIAVAFRGSEGAPGSIANPFDKEVGNLDWTGPDRALLGMGKNWDMQFGKALAVTAGAVELRDQKYKDYEVVVTGHSLGGGEAQIASKGCGVRGFAFDAPGAANVVATPEFRDWVAAHPVNGGGGFGNVINFRVQGSVATHAPGGSDYVGKAVPVSGSWPTYGDVSQEDRHDRHRLVDLFQDAVETGSLKKSDDRQVNDAVDHARPQGASFREADPRLANLEGHALDGVAGLAGMGTPPRSREELAEMASNAAIGAGFDPARPVQIVAARDGQSFFVVQGDPRDPASSRVAVNPDQPPPAATLPPQPDVVANEQVRSQAMSM